ncbi:MAG TPA: nucleotidyltransferase domain-containing protein, partial [Burkholderiales bacterium]|nr:nucleotidyltransferase domain-containing protein [Burkholderiales bacterium]
MPLQTSTAAVQPPSSLQLRKQDLAAEREKIRESFAAHPAAPALLRRLSALVDKHVRAVWDSCALSPDIALVAVGGYGRGQLFPYSDVDILILLPGAAEPELRARLEELIGALWDIGLEVGHSVRTIEECVEMAHQDITVQTTLLESRLIAGQRALFRRYLQETTRALDPRAFRDAKMLEQQQRHARFQETSLEPHVKESAGGLRDLQNILWIARASGAGTTWKELADAGLISPVEAASIRREERFLQTLRVRLHYLAQRREDRLLFDHQSILAAQFGLRDRPHRLASEQLMQRYYRTAKVVSQLNTIVLQSLAAR